MIKNKRKHQRQFESTIHIRYYI